MNAVINSIEMKKSRTGDPAIVVVLVTDDKQWVRDWIGIKAPHFVTKRWLDLLNMEGTWDTFFSHTALDLIGLNVDAECEKGDYGLNVKNVKLAGEKTHHSPPSQTTHHNTFTDDDVPF